MTILIYIFSKNVGMGAGNNIGIKSCKTKYFYILNPDTILNKNTMKNLIKALKMKYQILLYFTVS